VNRSGHRAEAPSPYNDGVDLIRAVIRIAIDLGAGKANDDPAEREHVPVSLVIGSDLFFTGMIVVPVDFDDDPLLGNGEIGSIPQNGILRNNVVFLEDVECGLIEHSLDRRLALGEALPAAPPCSIP